MITSRRSYRLLRVLEAGSRRPVLVHLCLDRARSNLALARRELATVRVGTLAHEEPTPAPLTSPATPATPATQWSSSRTFGAWRPAAGDGPAPPGSVAVPLPRRVVAQPRPAPAPVPAEVPARLRPVLAQHWSTDRDTLGRLLDALRALT